MAKMDVSNESNDEYFTPNTSFNEVEEVEEMVATTGGSG